jgi:hypothetical protein
MRSTDKVWKIGIYQITELKRGRRLEYVVDSIRAGYVRTCVTLQDAIMFCKAH